jgi:hypothetical protein
MKTVERLSRITDSSTNCINSGGKIDEKYKARTGYPTKSHLPTLSPRFG